MEMPAERPSIGQDSDRRWLSVTRLALLACLLLMLFHLSLAVLPWMLPYLLVLIGMRSQRWREAALMWAMLIGALGMILWLSELYFAGDLLSPLLTATNVLLFLSARKMVRKRTLWVRVVRWSAAALVVSCALVLTGLVIHISRGRQGFPEASAASTLRAIHQAQVTYASTYPHKGYSISLAVLDAPPQGKERTENAADLMGPPQGPDLATGLKAGYRFTYIPGPFDLKGRITGYCVIARPLKYDPPGVRSFYIDESGVLRATSEDRAATAQDPPL